MEIICKKGNWDNVKRKPKDLARGVFDCEPLHQKEKRKTFLHFIMIGDDKCV